MVGKLRPHGQASIMTAAFLAIALASVPMATADCHPGPPGCLVNVASTGGVIFEIAPAHSPDDNAEATWWFDIQATGILTNAVPAIQTLPEAQTAVITFGASDYIQPNEASVTVALDGIHTVSTTLGFNLIRHPDPLASIPFTIIVDGGGLGNTYTGTFYMAAMNH